jgi:hypothetical protein
MLERNHHIKDLIHPDHITSASGARIWICSKAEKDHSCGMIRGGTRGWRERTDRWGATRRMPGYMRIAPAAAVAWSWPRANDTNVADMDHSP